MTSQKCKCQNVRSGTKAKNVSNALKNAVKNTTEYFNQNSYYSLDIEDE